MRQHQLEALGWKFHRIWSTDWFMRKSEEVERAVAAFDEAVRYADGLDSSRPNGNGTSNNGSHNKLETLEMPKPNGRTAKPFFIPGQPINTYSQRQLIQIIKWLSSDGLMRTDDELLREAVDALGFKRRGVRIDNALTNAIQACRSGS